jgi:hypothetical protein
MSETSPSTVQWGKVIAGAAIAAGAVAAFAFFAVDIQSAVVPALTSAMQQAGSAIAIGSNWIGENIVGGISGFITQNTALAATAAAVAGGLIGGRMGDGVTSEKAAEAKSYALAEQLSRADALMQARMIANGYQPAMAMAKAPGRG